MVRIEDLGPAEEYTIGGFRWVKVPVKGGLKEYYHISPIGNVYKSNFQIGGMTVSGEEAKIVLLAAWPIYDGEI